MRNVVLILAVLSLFGGWRHFQQAQMVAAKVVSHDQVIMYSLTTCGFCKRKAREMRGAGIEFTEYFIDQDADRRAELNRKLEQAGLPRRSYGVPILDVHGAMLPNNPSLAAIKSHLEGG